MAVNVNDAGTSGITTPDAVYGPGAGHRDETGIGGNPYPYGECTYYVWQYYNDVQHIKLPPNMGNATDWVTSAHREQWAVDDNPVAGKIAVWSAAKYPPFGHNGVVSNLNGDGSFDVLEMNFTYFEADNPSLAGKIDKRTVKDRDGILGFITPNGATVSNDSQNKNDGLSLGLSAIGDAIKQAGLYIEAEAMTAQHKLTSMGQVGVGMVGMGGGLALMTFTLAGKGDPGQGYSAIKGKIRSARKPVRQLSARNKAFRDAETAWLSRKAHAEAAENKRFFESQKQVGGLTDRADIARDRRAIISAHQRRNAPIREEAIPF